ncbi:immunoglobulin mu heavy chain-like [Latimeria chalumnae]|uniref:immunoglobulin mu heavy chain-like n=1 Tax=Latimeria chalumnae TaxID=7897 RepID=UPI00313AE74F
MKSVVLLTESGGDIKKPGESLMLSCKASDVNFNSYHMEWVRQHSGKGLEWIAEVENDGDIYYAPSVQGRFAISRDVSSSMLYLQMNNLKVEDTATYYSGKGVGLEHWGQGTMVTVSSANKAAPSVFPLVPCCGDPISENQVTIGCLVTGFFPEPVDIKWNDGAAVSTGIRKYSTVQNSQDGTYTMSSQLTITSTEWLSKTYKCDVTHNPTSTAPVTKIVQKPECAKPTEPTLKLLATSCDMSKGEKPILMCLITGFTPSIIDVKWKVDKKEVSSAATTLPVRGADHKYTATSTLQVENADDWNGQKEYTCEVTHSATGTSKTAKIRKCSACVGSMPQPVIYPIKPSAEELVKSGNSKAACLVVGNYLKDTSISWEVNGRATKEGVEAGSVKTNPNKTESLMSTISVSINDWQNGVTFKCKVKHSCLEGQSPMEKTIQKPKGEVIPPKVSIFPLTYEEAVEDETVILTCAVRGFFPDEIYVKWMVDGKDAETSKYVNDPIIKGSSNTFSMESRLSISNININQRQTYKCVATTLEKKVFEDSVKDIFASRRPSIPTVQLLQSETDRKKGKVELVCLASGFSPKEILFEWVSRPGKEALRPTVRLPAKGEDGKFIASSMVTISTGGWNQDIVYSCTVMHGNLNITKTITKQDCQEYTPKPEIELLKPPFETLFLSKKAIITCKVVGQELAYIDITWTVKEKGQKAKKTTDGVEEKEEVFNADGTSTVSSVLTVDASKWNSRSTFTCTVANHTAIPTPESREIQKPNGIPLTPNVYILPPSSSEVSEAPFVTLVCLIKGFYPEDILVRWMYNDTTLPPSDYINSKPHHDENSYSMSSRLTVPKADWTKGTTYYCVVAHESTDPDTITRVINIHTIKPNLMNLSVVVTDVHSGCPQ